MVDFFEKEGRECFLKTKRGTITVEDETVLPSSSIEVTIAFLRSQPILHLWVLYEKTLKNTKRKENKTKVSSLNAVVKQLSDSFPDRLLVKNLHHGFVCHQHPLH